ncbi:MAG: hypothetical protein ACLQGP_01290 [Isosphaeraceae bacterium]
MPRSWTVAIGLLIGLNLLAKEAGAQMMYPGGYVGYGMSQWGSSPEAGLMAGLGAYARGQGVYELEKAKADSIKADTMIKWNKALRARQAALRADRQKEAAEREVERGARLEQRQVEDGTTLNNLLSQIFDADPAVVKSADAKAPLSPGAIREIPFEWDSEAITTCIDQMTGTGAIPPLLMDPKFVDQRDALRAAVEPALKEDAKGDVSPETRKRIDRAVADFRAKFVKDTADYQPGYLEALEYLTTLASLNKMLHDPSMKKFLAMVEDGKERTVGHLIAFMNAYNLRFGPAKSDRQVEIYTRLVPILTKLRDDVNAEPARPISLDKSGEGMKSAAKEAFKGMKWDELQAHSRDQ